MKKIILLVVAFVSFAAVSSCSNDDDNASLEGKWEYSQEGFAKNGQEFLEDYEHQSGCDKDYSMISATTIEDHSFFGTTCEEDVYNIPYTRNGNTITISGEGATFPAEIKTLNSSTLKIYITDPDFPEYTDVAVFKRAN